MKLREWGTMEIFVIFQFKNWCHPVYFPKLLKVKIFCKVSFTSCSVYSKPWFLTLVDECRLQIFESLSVQ